MTASDPVSARTSCRGAATRDSLLAAAREVFLRCGYAQASVAEIVRLAGASIGSLYHHFSGKADLYLQLYERLRCEHLAVAKTAVRLARSAGVTDPVELFLAGARGYLDVCAGQRELARLFVTGDGPPGFDRAWRKDLSQWVAMNAEFFARAGRPVNPATAIVVTGAMVTALSEMAQAPDTATALCIADSVLEVLGRLRKPVRPAAGNGAAGHGRAAYGATAYGATAPDDDAAGPRAGRKLTR